MNRRFGLPLVAALAGCVGETPPPPRSAGSPIAPEPGVLRVCGTGAMVPLARALAPMFAMTGEATGLQVIVEDAIGSGGAVRAAADGAIDVGMVSRPLSPSEAALGLEVVPVARDAVIIAAHPDVTVGGLSSNELVALYAGRSRRLPDGSLAILLLRDRSESENLALDAAIPGMAEARARSYGLGFRVLYRDDQMAAALTTTPNSLGVHSLALLRASRIPLKVLALDGRQPSVAAIASGEWPITRPLAFVLRPDRKEKARMFLEFALSPAGRSIARATDYLPIGEARRSP